MFTGLVQAVGRIEEVRHAKDVVRLVVDPGDLLRESAPAGEFTPGESICISGACLTLLRGPGGPGARLEFDAVPETMRRTTLSRLNAGSRVNLERSVTPSTLLGGHIVQGHVDGIGEVVQIRRGDDWRVRIRPAATPAAAPGGGGGMEYITPKGSIAVDGVSLTVASLGEEGSGPREWFEVALIPVTLQRTTLGGLQEGDAVNLEYDVLSKTVVHWLKNYSGAWRRG